MKKTILFTVLVFVILISKSQNLAKNLNTYHAIGITTFASKPEVSNVPEDFKFINLNLGSELNYAFGISDRKIYGIEGGILAEATPFNYYAKANKEDFDLRNSISKKNISYNYAFGVMLQTFFNIATKYQTYRIGVGVKQKYYVYDTKQFYGDYMNALESGEDLSLVKADLEFKEYPHNGGYLNYFINFGIHKEKVNYKLVLNISDVDVVNDEITFLENSNYETKGNYRYSGNYIGLDIQFLINRNKH